MSNILDFKKKQPIEWEEDIVTMYVSIDQDGAYSVHAEINDVYTDAEIFEALMAATVKFGIDSEILVEEEEDASTIH